MASPEANQFKETILARITSAYSQIETERVYLLLSDVSLGSPSPGLAREEAQFVTETIQLLKNEYGGLSASDVQFALSQLAQETDRARRLGQEPVVSTPKPETKPVKPQAPRRLKRDRFADVTTAYVRDDHWSYVRAWNPRKRLLGLQFDSKVDVQTFAKELARGSGFQEELSPAPPELAALTIEVSAPGFDAVYFAGSAVGKNGAHTLIDVPALPPTLRKAAAKLRAKISSAHSSVWTPEVDAEALSTTAASESPGSGPYVTDVSESRPVPILPPEILRPTSEHRVIGRKRRSEARSGQNVSVPDDDTATSDFARIPTGGGRDPSVGSPTKPDSIEAGSSARRRRARAGARSQSHTGSPARVVEDELKRFGRRTGRRTRTRTHNTVPEQDAVHPGPTTEEFVPGSASGRGDTQAARISAETNATHPVEQAEQPVAIAPTSAPPKTERSTPVPEPIRQPAPPTQRPTSMPGPVESVDLDAESSIEVGRLIARKDGSAAPGGAAAIVLDAAAAYPGSLVTINSRTRTWKLAIREDVALHLDVTPREAEFSIETAIRRSRMVQPADLQQAVADAQASGQKLTEVLVKSRKLLFRQLDAVLSARAQLMFHALFEEEITSYSTVGYESIENKGASHISAAPAAWQHLKKACNDLNQTDLDHLLSAHYADRPRFITNGFLNAQLLRLTTKETKFVNDLLVGECTASQGVAKSPLRRRQSLALVLALDRIGLLEWEKVETAATRVARVWSMIQTKLKELDGPTNPFEVLEAHWSSDEKLIGESFLTLCRILDLDYVQQNGTPEEQETAARLREGLGRTRGLLHDRKKRRDYRCDLVDEFNRRNAVRLYEKQAELALFKADYASAEDSLRRVVEMAPTHPTAGSQLRGVIDVLKSQDQ